MARRYWHFSQTTKVIVHVTPIKRGGAHRKVPILMRRFILNLVETVDQLSIETLIGSCRIKEMLDVKGSIGFSDLEEIQFDRVERDLFKTNNSSFL